MIKITCDICGTEVHPASPSVVDIEQIAHRLILFVEPIREDMEIPDFVLVGDRAWPARDIRKALVGHERCLKEWANAHS